MSFLVDVARSLSHKSDMNVDQTEEFDGWLKALKDVVARRAIVRRLLKLQPDDHFGDVKALDDDLNEMRFHIGPGYRVYYTLRDDGTVSC